MSSELREISDHMEMLLNHRVPAGVLTGIEALSECIRKGTQDVTSVSGCRRNKRKIACYLEILQKGDGIVAHRLVALPYMGNRTALKLDFPGVLFKMPGLIMDVSACTDHQGFLKCHEIQSKANDCLENIL